MVARGFWTAWRIVRLEPTVSERCEVWEEGLTVSCSDHHPSVLGWEVLVWYDPAATGQSTVDEAGDETDEGCEVPCRVASCPAIK
jgi:hypothetical protein